MSEFQTSLDQRIARAGVLQPRFPLPDILRGIAILAMVAYHAVWTAGYFQFLAPDLLFGPAGHWTARAITTGFLLLVGMGIVLSHEAGFDRWRLGKRVLLVGGAAALVSGATFWSTPEQPIVFGILHAIALSSLFALPFLRLPKPVLLTVAGVLLTLPVLLPDGIFNASGWLWLGLMRNVSPMGDYVPLIPWFGIVLIGMVLIRMPALRAVLLKPFEVSGMARILQRLGRWSLVIYLVHQPVLFGLASGIAWLAPGRAHLPAAFTQSCVASCTQGGNSAPSCATYCSCAVDAITAAGLTALAKQTTVSETERSTLVAAVAVCKQPEVTVDPLAQ